VGQLVPEPRERLAEDGFELLGIGSFCFERHALEETGPIEECAVLARAKLVQRPLAAEEDLSLRAVGQHERHDAAMAEVLDEHGLAQPLDQ
jgi:hypothetical protein